MAVPGACLRPCVNHLRCGVADARCSTVSLIRAFSGLVQPCGPCCVISLTLLTPASPASPHLVPTW
ncbi:uncharacterized protein EI90DRAFT_3037675 [Cantharellus anzutake]|uniref:uncharacterized protein n=1 Tax=Cantharellus anzutake TaxID=1750568 RepID=UPI00190454FE|nr:uncharacterized protein EI90DRAFT_3037675 [Cantharellus anzutake]KAF8339756.1 hypothetical protein EI90DRAFT_3037675 [Cantharellus anzutake]